MAAKATKPIVVNLNHNHIQTTTPPPPQPIVIGDSENNLPVNNMIDPSVLKKTEASSSLSAAVIPSVGVSTTTSHGNTRRRSTTSSSNTSKKRTANNTKSAASRDPTAVKHVGGSTTNKDTYNLTRYIEEKDRQGCSWMVELEEDLPPKKLFSIPDNTVVEFTNWDLYRKDGVNVSGGCLYTANKIRYWPDTASLRWLEAAMNEGKTPENTTFLIRHIHNSINNSDHRFRYGFKARKNTPKQKKVEEEEEEDPIENSEEEEKMVLDENSNQGDFVDEN